jgi:uncharacterized membrane protein
MRHGPTREAVTALGLFMLWRAVTRQDVPLSGRTLFGAMVFGWGLFNLVEGLIDHHVHHVHHVVERLGVSVWDWLFLGVGGVGLMALGRVIIGTGRRDGLRHAFPSPSITGGRDVRAIIRAGTRCTGTTAACPTG